MAHILVVEDHPDQAAFVVAALERLGHSCRLATDGRKALLAVAEGVDLVVTDVFMPDMDGIELMRSLRDAGCRVPVVAMTGGVRHRLGVFLNTMLALGAKTWLTKPFATDELDAAVSAALGESCAPSRDGADRRSA